MFKLPNQYQASARVYVDTQSVAVAFVIAQLWPTFDSQRSLMQATNVPVFGSVGAILSLTAVRRERLKTLMFVTLFILLLLLYLGLLIAT